MSFYQQSESLPADTAVPASLAETLARLLTGLSLAVLFLISPMVLFQAGLNYEDVGGSPLEKVHPGNLIALLAFGFRALGRGPWRYTVESLRDNPGLLVYLVTTFFILWFTIFIQKEPFTPLVDTFIPVVALFLLLKEMPETVLSRYATLLHLIFAANALLALYEYLSGNRLTPYVAGTVQIGEDDWRATAFIGHPLANAMMTGTYILTLASRGGGGLGTYPRTLMLLLQLSSMVAFGARASLVTMLLMLALLGALNLVRILTGGMKISLRFLGLCATAMPLMIVGLVALDDIGFFDRLIDRFLEDKGSASTRIAMFELFKYLSLNDFLFGPDQALIGSLKGVEGIESGIESFWVAFTLGYGLLPSLLFFTGLFAFSVNVCLRIRPYAFYVFVFFFLVASTSVSLSAKSPLFGMFVSILIIMLRPVGVSDRRDRG
ncbi:MAG: VpsF family polysaccharide biosynthesis protein [Beijerinckiaceae bacterium]|nr:VpsF family polysaccharide biosynthesis protein [Beijerinckiaceae bacterium]